MAVYLGEYIHPEAQKYLKDHAEVLDTLQNPEAIEAIILRVFPVDAALMDRCPNLKVIGKHGVGCNTIDLDAARERGITVINTPHANSNSVAELIVGLILNVARNITLADRKSRRGDFQAIAPKEMTGVELTGKTLGLVGTGNIARRAAQILQGGFGVKIVAYDPYVPAEVMTAWGYTKYETVADMVENADIINVSVPLTPETENLISGEVFDRFREDAILINAARGGIVNEDDLYHALKEGKLRAAACDSFVTEPPTEQTTKLYELDNFVGTPHIGAATQEALYHVGMEVVRGVVDILEGRETSANRVV